MYIYIYTYIKQEWWPDFKSEKLCRAEKEEFRDELFGLDNVPEIVGNSDIREMAMVPLMDEQIYTWQISTEFGKTREDVLPQCLKN